MNKKINKDFISNRYIGKQPYESIYKLNLGLSLDEYEAYEALKNIFKLKNKEKRTILMTMLLNGIMVKKPSVAEVRGLLKASLELDNMFETNKPKIDLPNNNILLGLAASGKKGIKTFNISTTAAIVASANGAYIAKACSSSTSSKTGSSDFLSLLGIDVNLDYEEKTKILKKIRIIFCSIERATPKFAELYSGIFYAPHAMSYALAALSFPISVDTIVYGLSHPNVKLSIDVLNSFGINNAFVYTSTEDGVHYLDELGISGFANVVGIKDGVIGRQVMTPIKREFNLNESYTNEDIAEGNTPLENVKIAVNALKGNGPKSIIDAICINASVLLCLSKKAKSLKAGYDIALKSIEDGTSYRHFIDIVIAYGGSEQYIESLLRS